MTIVDLYKKLKQILNDCNKSLRDKGLPSINNLYEIPSVIESAGELNRLPYVISKEIIEVTADDLTGVVNIGSAFYECKSLQSVTIPDSVTTIDMNAFRNCSSLIYVAIPDSVTTLGLYAFSGCSSLENITIPDSVTKIDDCAFWQCTKLTEVIIGTGITTIGSEAFKYCSNLTNVYIKSTDPPSLYDQDVFPNTTRIHIRVGSGDAYMSAANWSYYASIGNIIEDI